MLKEKILKTIKTYDLIEKGDKVVVGVSGGPDSICLVNLLLDIQKDQKIDLDFEMVVAHVNHMIRKDAGDDEKFVEDYCKKNKIPFIAKTIDVLKIANQEKMGTEEAGRKARYLFFEEVLKHERATKIATAHTKCDQAETVLMNLIRGTGLVGIKGIQAKRDEIFIKPLLEISREEVEGYCREKKLQPRYDKTNDENIYTRNKIRNLLLPLLQEEFNPNIIETLCRLSRTGNY